MVAQVLVDIAHAQVDRLFSYTVEPGLSLAIGHHVLVPFGRGNKQTEGFVLGLTEDAQEGEYILKPVTRLLAPYPVFDEKQLALAQWIRQSYHCLLVDALRLMIPAQMRGGRVKEKTLRLVEAVADDAQAALLYRKDGAPKAPRQAEVFAFVKEAGAPVALADLFLHFPGAQSAVGALIKKGLLVERGFVAFRTPHAGAKMQAPPVTLTAEQEIAVRAVNEATDGQSAQTFLLHGVTGSGKTEVYMRCIQHCIEGGKGAILLVPEIALTPQTMGLFRARFGERVALLHSRLSAGERFDEWRRIRLGLAKVAVGARSAVFAPLETIGLLIIDEEHEQSYQSESAPRYHALEVARTRAMQSGAPLLLGSATPSIQSYYRAKTGLYSLLTLTSRVQARPMPAVEIVDMRAEFQNGNNSIFSTRLYKALQQCLQAGRQAILFLNRRGYSTFLSCRGCGYVFECPHCDISLTYHRTLEHIRCHYCGYTAKAPSTCPSCGQAHVKYFGVGTQQVEAQLLEHFPAVRALRMDMDTTRSKDAHETMFHAFARGEAQVLIGTQMVAKGFDFPNVTLVGVIAADSTLHLPDYRSSERTFQLLMQVAGRAGRDQAPGHVIVQSYTPEHPSIRFAAMHDYKGFFKYELMQRRAALFPPFSLFIRILLTGGEEAPLAKECARVGAQLEQAVQAALPDRRELLYLNASPAPIGRREGIYRYQVLLKLLRTKHTAGALRAVYAYLDAHRPVHFAAHEINPGDLF